MQSPAWRRMGEAEGEMQLKLETAKETYETRIESHGEKFGKKCINPEDFEVQRQIGAGSFGEVFLVCEGATGRQFAMKRVRRAKVVEGREADEASLLSALSCPFVVRLVAAWEDAAAVTLVMEHMPGGELFLLLRQVGAMEEHQARFYVSQVVLALEHLH